ncbi:Leucine-rich repeat (LRR) family protein [Abeliophyllum distichum]|uniref:Cell wall hydroxyproline-rich glycoprotein n=1 Tax=Abeliophyllum distichum TaxID=126358 RepID=A0ABD1QVJ6_9LAMI
MIIFFNSLHLLNPSHHTPLTTPVNTHCHHFHAIANLRREISPSPSFLGEKSHPPILAASSLPRISVIEKPHEIGRPIKILQYRTWRKSCFWQYFFLRLFVTEAAVSVGGGVGIGVGGGAAGGGGGVWVGGGINTSPSTPSAGAPQVSNLNAAYTALQAWKSAITDDPNGIVKTWVGSNVCAYKGVFCADSQDFTGSSTGPVVAAIDLNHANLQGILVKQLSLLTDLSLLHLNSNRFSGTVPESFKEFTYLTELDLSNNRFSGPFPITTLYIPNLKYLDLRFNSFSGPIPEDLFNKQQLDAIFLNNNQFDSELPQNLGNSPASVVNLANNKFTGNIPFSLGYIGSRVREILFLNNQLTGCIPEGVGLWSDLQVLDVSSNSLMGHLPDSISCLSQIEVLNLANNKLSGELPDLVCELRTIMNLTVASNFFSGFSQDCNKLPFRNVGFDFSFNCIPGKEMQRPQPDCSMIPGGGLSCLRIPAKPLVCGVLGVGAHEQTTNPTP